jgi:hypothetical protein
MSKKRTRSNETTELSLNRLEQVACMTRQVSASNLDQGTAYHVSNIGGFPPEHNRTGRQVKSYQR